MKMNSCDTWFYTSCNEARGYIQPQSLEELWFHTGTNCNLRCPFCLKDLNRGIAGLSF